MFKNYICSDVCETSASFFVIRLEWLCCIAGEKLAITDKIDYKIAKIKNITAIENYMNINSKKAMPDWHDTHLVVFSRIPHFATLLNG